MQKFTITTILLSLVLIGYTQPLVDAAWLKEHLKDEDLVIFHVGKEDTYQTEHIPRAQHLDSEEFTLDEGDRVFDLPPQDDLKSVFERKGVTNNSRIIIYTGVNWVPLTTRLLFTFDCLGLGEKVSILDGGLVAWKAAGGEVTAERSMLPPGSLKFTPKSELVVDKSYVQSVLDQNTKIVDCRASVYYEGIEVNEMHGGRKGHLPGAKTIPFTSLYEKTENGSYEFKSPEALGEIFEKQGLKKDDHIVLYCHIGLQLTVVYTASKLLGYEDVKVYDASFHEWGADPSLPVEAE